MELDWLEPLAFSYAPNGEEGKEAGHRRVVICKEIYIYIKIHTYSLQFESFSGNRTKPTL